MIATIVIPLWAWPLMAGALLWLVAWVECREINGKVENFRAIEAERIARLNAHPMGNVDRRWDWDFNEKDAA